MKKKIIADVTYTTVTSIKLTRVNAPVSSVIPKVKETDNRLFAKTIKLAFTDDNVEVVNYVTSRGDESVEEYTLILPKLFINKIEYAVANDTNSGTLHFESLIRFEKSNWIYLGNADLEDLSLDIYEKDIPISELDSDNIKALKEIINDSKFIVDDSNEKNGIIIMASTLNKMHDPLKNGKKRPEIDIKKQLQFAKLISEVHIHYKYFDKEGILKMKDVKI